MNLNQVIDQAKDSAFGTLQAAREFVLRDRSDLTNKRILASLKKLGVATQAEVRLLQSRIEKLEAELKTLKAKGPEKSSEKI